MKYLKTKFGPLLLVGFALSVLLLAFFFSTTYSNEVLAQSSSIDETGASGFVICGNEVDNPCNISHLFRAFIIIINYLITMAGLVAILIIVLAGVQMTMSRGEEWLRQAKSRMTGAVAGLVLVAAAFVLINSMLSGSLNLGVRDGAKILTNPKEYIQGAPDEAPTTKPKEEEKKPDEETVSDNEFAPVYSGRPGTGEGSDDETLASLVPAPNAEFCLIREASRGWLIDKLIPTAFAQRVACKEVKTKSGTLFPYILRQQEYPGDYPGCPKAGDVQSGGCGPTALGMALWARQQSSGDVKIAANWKKWTSDRGYDPFSPWAIAQLVAANGGRGCFEDGKPNGSTNDFAVKVAPSYGIWAFTTSSENQIDYALEHGNYVIARMKKNSRFTGGGHFVLLWAKDNNYGNSGQKWYYIADPNANVDVRVARSTIFYEDLNDAQVLVFNPS